MTENVVLTVGEDGQAGMTEEVVTGIEIFEGASRVQLPEACWFGGSA